MGWILLSLILLVSSVLMYLLIRKMNLAETPLEIQNLSMFLVPTVVFFAWALLTGKSFYLPAKYFLINAGAAIVLSWLGNVISLKAIRDAPNPGYSLVISKSYAVMTAILSVWLFKAPFTLLDAVSIAMIVGFSSLILLGEKREGNRKPSSDWIPLTFGAFLAWGFLALVSAYLLRLGFDATVLLFYRMGIVAAITVGEIAARKVSFGKILRSPAEFATFLFVGILSTSFNLSMNLGYKVAPNPGYINAVNASSIAVLSIASAIIFKDDLTPRKMVGVAGVVGGLVLLFI